MSKDPSQPDEPGRELETRAGTGAGVPEPVPTEGEAVGGELLSAATTGDLATTEPLGLIDKFKVANLRSKKELEAVRVVLDTQLELLRHRAEATSRESKAHWDGKSAEVVSAMKTFVQARLRGIENQRMASRLDSLQAAYELFADKVREVESGSLPEELRQGLIQKMHENLAGTIARLESDAIADKYDMTD